MVTRTSTGRAPGQRSGRRWRHGAGIAVLAVAIGCSSADGGETTRTYDLPGETVFPEGIGIDATSGDFYVGSTSDGTVYRGNVDSDDVEVFLPGGQDGRDAVTGVKVDDQGRLWLAGRDTGRAFVYDAGSGELIRALSTPASERALINDLTFTPDAAFVTDSFRPVIWRVARSPQGVGPMRPWLDLRDTLIPTDTNFGLNGIAASDDGRTLLSVHFDTGQLFHIDVASKEVTEVDLGGETLATGDGMLLADTTLLVVREDPGAVYPVQLSADLSSGEVGEPFGDDFLLPTTLAQHQGQVLVVNSQLNDTGSPDLPFTVSNVPLPDGVHFGSH